MIRRHVAEVRKPLVYVNTVGAADNGKNVIAFDGESLVYDGHGRLIAIGPQFEEELLVVDLGAGAVRTRTSELPPIDREREIYDALVMGLRDYMRKSHFTDAVVPVSGRHRLRASTGDRRGRGRARARPRLQPALAVQHRDDAIDRRAAVVALGVRYGVIPIWSIDEEVRATFERHAHPIERSLTRENLHARIRGLLMMAESNDTGALLISCGNETEIALGYATLYGDMCGGISVIGDLSKVDVYRLARHVNARHGRAIIPEETFTLKPSAELAPGSVRSVRLLRHGASRQRARGTPPERVGADRAVRRARRSTRRVRARSRRPDGDVYPLRLIQLLRERGKAKHHGCT